MSVCRGPGGNWGVLRGTRVCRRRLLIRPLGPSRAVYLPVDLCFAVWVLTLNSVLNTSDLRLKLLPAFRLAVLTTHTKKIQGVGSS